VLSISFLNRLKLNSHPKRIAVESVTVGFSVSSAPLEVTLWGKEHVLDEGRIESSRSWSFFLHHFLKAAPIWCENLHSIPNILALPINIGHTSCNSTFQPLKQQQNTFNTRQAMLKMALTSDP
jgi:hypothetical protein